MKFLDYKKFLDEHQDFYLYKAVVVSEVDYFSDLIGRKMTDDEFTSVCEFVYDWIQNSSATAAEVAQIICTALGEKELSFEDFDDYETDSGNSVAEEWLNNYF